MSTSHITQMSTTRTGVRTAKNDRRTGAPNHQQAEQETSMLAAPATPTDRLWAAMFEQERAEHRATSDYANGLARDNAHLRGEIANLTDALNRCARRAEVDADTIAELRHEIDGGNH